MTPRLAYSYVYILTADSDALQRLRSTALYKFTYLLTYLLTTASSSLVVRSTRLSIAVDRAFSVAADRTWLIERSTSACHLGTFPRLKICRRCRKITVSVLYPMEFHGEKHVKFSVETQRDSMDAQWRRQAVKTSSLCRSLRVRGRSVAIQCMLLTNKTILAHPGRQPRRKLFSDGISFGASWCSAATVDRDSMGFYVEISWSILHGILRFSDGILWCIKPGSLFCHSPGQINFNHL